MDVSRRRGRERTSCNLSWFSRTSAALRREERRVREFCAKVRALDSRVGRVESNDESDVESESREDERVDVVVCRDRNVGYDV